MKNIMIITDSSNTNVNAILILDKRQCRRLVTSNREHTSFMTTLQSSFCGEKSPSFLRMKNPPMFLINQLHKTIKFFLTNSLCIRVYCLKTKKISLPKQWYIFQIIYKNKENARKILQHLSAETVCR